MITQTATGALQYRVESGAADLAELGLTIRPGLSAEAWRSIGVRLGKLDRYLPWKLGDWAFAGEKDYADYFEMSEISGLEYGTLQNYARVAGRYTLPRRRGNLSFSHHSEVASLGSDVEQDEWLDKAAQEGWSSKELRKALSEGEPLASTPLVDAPANDADETARGGQTPSLSESALLEVLVALRKVPTLDDAREISARADLEGISASAWLRRYLDELRGGSVSEEATGLTARSGSTAAPEKP
jgi:hypothetical protein